MGIVDQNVSQFGVAPACTVLGASRATYYRWKHRPEEPSPSRRKPPRRLTEQEEHSVLEVLTSDRFINQGVPTAYTTLLDEGIYLCSPRTMYRVLKRKAQSRKQRSSRRRPLYQKPELIATGPNQVWSWDITRIKGPKPWIFYQLYVVIDVFSRYVVAWTLSGYESGTQASALIERACEQQGVGRNHLTVHADRGSAMRSKQLEDLLGELGVKRSFSRPNISNDNPYSEAQFKTLKYRPDYPKRFGSLEDALHHMRAFFKWYNTEHKHSGIAMMTPQVVHTGRSKAVLKNRKAILGKAYRRHPERFVKGRPEPRQVPDEVWINKPEVAVA